MSLPELPGLPRDDAGEPVFPGAWQARAFALATSLNEAGAFAWPAFSSALGEATRRDDDYWHAWLKALETVLAKSGLAPAAEVESMTARWLDAAAHTPHGTPIRLGPEA